MKKILASIMIAVSIAFILWSVLSDKGSNYSDLCITQTEYQQLMDSRTESTEQLFERILFDEYALFCDSVGNRMFYSLIESSDSAYNPYVECVSIYADARVAFVGSEISNEIIASGIEYDMIVYTEDAYQCFRLAFTTLPLLSINCGTEMPGDIAMPMSMKLFDNRKTSVQRMVASDGEIHIRGGWTRNFPKLGYKFTLYSDSVGNHRREWDNSLLGLRQDGDWVLYAAYTDQEKIRNVFCSKLWKDSCAVNNANHIDNGMEYRYVELFLNNQYWGLYALGYPIDALQLQMSEGEYMYEKSYPVMAETDIDFLVEGAPQGYVIKEFGVNSGESWSALKEYYQAMFYSEDEYASLKELADIENSIDIFLFLNMIQGVDHASVRGYNTIYNLYLTNKHGENGMDTILYTPWDLDRTWGNGFDNEPYDVEITKHCAMKSNIAYILLKRDDAQMKQQVVKRYKELRKGPWSDEQLSQLIHEYEVQIYDSGAFSRDKSRWPEGWYSDEADRLDVFEEYVLKRVKYMDEYVEQYNN
ncbi:MAG: hypothetical protein E7292_02900 [Lachnospiraceae bacterium]|nr:hypothetical protein [Lachnospiraceae bacterium]